MMGDVADGEAWGRFGVATTTCPSIRAECQVRTRGFQRVGPYLLFIGSGAAALIQEAVFLRQTVWLFGSSAKDPALSVDAARLSWGTEFFLYGLGCAAEQLESLPAALPADAANRSHRCESLRGPR